MAIGGCEVSYCFYTTWRIFRKTRRQVPYFFMAEETKDIIPDLTDIDEVRKAIIANEILTRKY